MVVCEDCGGCCGLCVVHGGYPFLPPLGQCAGGAPTSRAALRAVYRSAAVGVCLWRVGQSSAKTLDGRAMMEWPSGAAFGCRCRAGLPPPAHARAMRKRGAPPVGPCLVAALRRRAVSARIFKPAEDKRPTIIQGPFAEAHLAGGPRPTSDPAGEAGRGTKPPAQLIEPGAQHRRPAGKAARPTGFRGRALVLALPGGRAVWYGATPPQASR